MTNVVINPPNGEQYGFPKVVTMEEFHNNILNQIQFWIVENGYPQDQIDAMGTNFYVGWNYIE
jgi:hypothetical protein